MADTTIQCFWCAVPMTAKTIFGKTVYECPKCKRRVPEENIVTIPDAPADAGEAAATDAGSGAEA